MARLKQRAERNGRSLEAELRQVITEAAKPSVDEVLEQARELRECDGARIYTDTVELVRQTREGR